jgi:hypothetical protein
VTLLSNLIPAAMAMAIGNGMGKILSVYDQSKYSHARMNGFHRMIIIIMSCFRFPMLPSSFAGIHCDQIILSISFWVGFMVITDQIILV